MAAITNATSVSITSGPSNQSVLSKRSASKIAHHRDQDDVNDGKQRKCIAEGLVHHVPEMEHFLGAGEKQHALGDGRLFARQRNLALHVRMLRTLQSSKREYLFAESEMPPSQGGDLEHAVYIQQHHVDQRHHGRQFLHSLRGRQTQHRSQVGLRKNPLLGQLLCELCLNLLNFLQRKLRSIQTSWDLSVKIASDDAAQRNREHDPKSDAGKAAKLERGVERNHERCRESQQDVVVQPVPRTPLSPQPC